ncbi:30S ribosomal protein S12 methylthiotransferase RimO [Mahella sp.]|uniref:30S ribosomal protein S12 methylthiotransferase RimO n=1 Tax=Mahella sp. TaxID=2798721 RepID=UPI00341C3BDE|nr:ribosomal protein methylthiotransferase [Mahella sp.]MDK2903117.1 ribosomal protein methylthiotransferase [Clostridiales bacterium]
MLYNIGMISLGCPKNLVDSEIMLAELADKGYAITNDPKDADVIIINTCSFIETAKQESINTILEMAGYKETGRCKGLIAVGCLSQQYKEQLLDEIPELNAVIGTGDYHSIGLVVDKILNGSKVAYFEGGDASVGGIEKRVLSTPPYMAYVKIAEGCDNGCSYCIIPFLRGHYRSRPMEDIVEECKELVDRGVKEIILIAQDTSVYGRDIYGRPRLAELLHELDNIDNVEWIRVLYCYPDYVDDELIEVIAQSRHICHYIDIPIQHVNDKILAKMGRCSRSNDIKGVIERLRKRMPDIAIRTSLIVGFPGETDREFEELRDFVEQYKLDNVGVFTYSQEEGTIAAAMPEQVPEDVKQERYKSIMRVQRKIVLEKNRERIGLNYKVLVEGCNNGVYVGRGYMHAPEIDGLIYFTSDKPLDAGQMLYVKITGVKDYDLTGEAI